MEGAQRIDQYGVTVLALVCTSRRFVSEHAVALHFLLQDAQSLIDVVFTDQGLHKLCSGAIQSALVVTSAGKHPADTRPMHLIGSGVAASSLARDRHRQRRLPAPPLRA